MQVKYPAHREEVYEIISKVKAKRLKPSKEKTMPGRMLFAPKDMNVQFKDAFEGKGYHEIRDTYVITVPDSDIAIRNCYKQIDFVKDKVLVEVQFGKYAFMVYNVCAKMTIFSNLKFIDTGIEIVGVKNFAAQMSSGVSYFEQFAWDLKARGVADIDIPVLILGIDA